MSYKEDVIKAYEESLRAYGMSELLIRNLVVAFISGFESGALNGSSEDLQQQKISLIMNEELVN